MFQNEYQGGQFFEVFTVQGKDPLVNWKVSSGVRKVYDRLVKGFIFALEGSGTTTKIQLPKDSKTSLTLVQRYLIVQLFIPSGQDFSVELGVTDLQKNKRRLFLSTAHKELSLTPLHAKIPLHLLKKGIWLNLCLDMVSLVGETWRGQTHKSLESITLSANCKLRKIFTMKTQPPDDDPDLSLSQSHATFEVDVIPKQFQLPTDVNQMTMVLTMNKIRLDGRKLSVGPDGVNQSMTDTDLTTSAARRGQEYRIAFGSKVAVQSAGAKRSKEGLVNTSSRLSRQFSKSRSDDMLSARGETPSQHDDVKLTDDVINDVDDHVTTDRRQKVERGSRSWSGGTIDLKDETPFNPPHPPSERPTAPPRPSNERSMAPHPPAAPSNERARRRFRVKSAGVDRMAARFSQVNYDDPSSESQTILVPKPSAEPATSPGRHDNHFTDSGLHSDVSGRHGNQRLASPITNGRPDNQRLRSPIINGRHGNHERSSHSSPHKPSTPDQLDLTDSPLPSNDTTHNTSDTGYQGNDSDFPGDRSNESNHGNLSRGGTLDQDDSISDVIEALRHQVKRIEVTSSSDGESGDDEEIRNSYEESDEEPSSGRNVYMFQSPPKLPSRLDDSTPKQPTNHRPKRHSLVRQLDSSSSRGPAPADDFRSSVSEDDYDVTHENDVTDNKSKLKMSRKSPKKASKNELSPGGNVSRLSISKRSLREIPRDDVRLTQLQSQPTYDSRRYVDLNDTDEMEERMLASLKRQAAADGEPEPAPAPGSEPGSSPGRGRHLEKHVYGDDSSSSEEDTNSFSTWKTPVPNLLSHHYQDEMELPSSRTSQDTLGSSNPRDWTGVFSPPIVLPGDMDHDKSDRSDDSSSHPPHLSGNKPRIQVNGETGERDGSEEELDLLYDQCLNCYFDPKSCRYYELV